MGPLTEQEEFVPKDHPSQVPIQIVVNNFTVSTDNKASIAFFWGVQDINRTGDSMWDGNYVGEAIMDPKFDISYPEAQIYLKNFCPKLDELEFAIKGSTDCWFRQFEKYVISKGLSIPIRDQEQFDQVLYDWATQDTYGRLVKT